MSTPEELARQNIDQMLGLARWSVQDTDDVDFTASRGIAIGHPDFAEQPFRALRCISG
jgi:hypothetical protein